MTNAQAALIAASNLVSYSPDAEKLANKFVKALDRFDHELAQVERNRSDSGTTYAYWAQSPILKTPEIF